MTTNFQSVDLIQARTVIKSMAIAQFSQGKYPKPVYLHGAPGVGKSQMTNELCPIIGDELTRITGRPCKVMITDLRLSGMDEAGVQGLPVVDHTGERDRCGRPKTYFSTPEWFENCQKKTVMVDGVEHDLYHILFLDELSNAPEYVQHPAYRLVLDRSIQNGEVFDNNVFVIAAGNRPKDNTGAKPVAAALRNRFATHLEIDEKRLKPGFIQYMIDNNFATELIAFLEWKSEHIYSAPVDGDYNFPSPRAWECMDTQFMKTDSIRKNPDLLISVLSGGVGQRAAQDLVAFMECWKFLPNWEKVKQGDTSYNIREAAKNSDGKDHREIQAALMGAVAFEISNEVWEYSRSNKDEKHKKAANNLMCVYNQLDDEMKIVTCRMIAARCHQLHSIVSHFDFYEELKRFHQEMRAFKELSAK